MPVDTTVGSVPRRVPQRQFTLPPREGIAIEPGGDLGAVFAVLSGSADEPPDWLRGGEALSAVMLTAVDLGLSTAPISDVIEVERPREVVRQLLDGQGYPFVVLRCGYANPAETLGDTPRRDPDDAIRGLPLW